LRLLLIAAPGGGKGTQGERLSALYGIQHISSGDVLRAEAQAGTPAGRELAAYQRRGDLVPDQTVLDLLIPIVAAAAARGGYILDGFPRTLSQAKTAAELGVRLDLTLDAAVYLHVPEPVLVQRLLARARPDDTPEVIRHRLEVFADTTIPLITYYRRDRGILVEVDADQPPESITAEIQARLDHLPRLARGSQPDTTDDSPRAG
jgi:adenylate kinase